MDPKDQNEQQNINIAIDGAPSDPENIMSLESKNENRVGLSKEELMKYANQPFWVRLRNILFASFWIVWLSILVVAISYVVYSPNCVKVVSAEALNGTITNITTTTPATPKSS